jgi:hypothetical protein
MSKATATRTVTETTPLQPQVQLQEFAAFSSSTAELAKPRGLNMPFSFQESGY